ncbi:MAG: SCO family protein [Candidatus Thiodiazotropha sp.]
MSRAESTSSHLVLLLGVGLTALLLGLIWFSRGIKDIQAPPGMPLSQDMAATLLTEPMTLPDFHLTDTKGEPFNKLALKDTWSFLFFGYTYCPDICPTTLALLGEVENLLRKSDLAVNRQYVFISVDPDRDTPDRLGEYLAFFNPLFIGATGAEREIQTLTKPLGIRYQRSPEERPMGDYLIDHSATILLTNPDGQLQALISPPHDAAVIAGDLQRIIVSVSD